MIIHDFDRTEQLISLQDFYGDRKHLIDVCLIIFSREIHQYLLDNFPCEEIGSINACNSRTPIYRTLYKGRPFAFYLSMIGSALASSCCYEAHWLTGAESFIMFGSCGSLDRETTDKGFIIPTEVYRGDGASYYYAEASDYLPVRNSDRLAGIFRSLRIPYVQGRVWTTDSMLRETKGLAARRRSEGCIAVEMELAGVEAICDYYGLRLYDFLEAGDVLAAESYEAEGLSRANHSMGKLFIALEVMLQL